MNENLDPVLNEPKVEEPVADKAPAVEAVATEEVESPKVNVESSETSEATVVTSEVEGVSDSVERKQYATRQEVLQRLEEIVVAAADDAKGEVSYLKMLYYKLRQQETDAALTAALEQDSEDLSALESKPDEMEGRLKELLEQYREQRAAALESRNREMAENADRKKALLDAMEAIATDANDVNVHYNQFMELQKQFKEIHNVDPAVVADLWKRYSAVTESFYDLLKINKELRDYDFKKNLEKKEELCQEAERLGTMGDVIAAFRRLQELHEEWKGVGPVSPTVREEIWTRFKAASTVVNKRHQDHFEQIKQKEAENEVGKKALCEKIEAIDFSQNASLKDWEAQTQQILDIQKEWRSLGFASRKVNTQLFERFRRSCDAFFAAKATFYKGVKDGQSENLAKKIKLCEKAEALKDSTEWRKTTDQFISLQREWKNIGAVPRKNSASLWKRFVTACDAFFEAKEKAVGSEKNEEKVNLEKKQSVIARLKELQSDIESVQPATVRELMAEWNSIGHVPFKEKDKVYNAYQEALEVFFQKLDMKGSRARMESFSENISKLASGNNPQSTLMRERERLMRVYERMTADLKNYENNLGFLNISSKSSANNPIVREIEKKKDALKAEIKTIVDKIELIDKQLE
jgi:hypothetical protein